jgi:hypothetical protein
LDILMGAEAVPVGALAPFTLNIPSWQLVAFGLALVSLFVHICVLSRASYSLRTLIGLSGLSLFLASITASELASQDNTGVQQLLWCLCTSILTDNYDPNTDANAWKRVMWMLSTWLQLGLMYKRTYVASSTIQQVLFKAVVVLKGMKLHFLHGWHCSSWDETKDDSKTQCEHLAAAATWLVVDWSSHLEQVKVTPAINGTIVEENAFYWRSLLEGKPRRATPEGVTIGRDCCDIAVKFLQTPSPVVPAVAFSIKRQFKAKLGSMATRSALYSYLAMSEMALAFSIIILMAWEWRKQEKRTLPAGMCLAVWCLELVYHEVTCKRAFHLEEEVHEQSSETCRSRNLGPSLWEAQRQTCLVITDLILGSFVEAVVTGLASIGKGANLWAKLSSNNTMQQLGAALRLFIAMCIVMPMAILRTGRKYLYDWWNGLWERAPKAYSWSTDKKQILKCITNLQGLQDLVRRYPDEMSMVQTIMYPSILGTTGSSVETPTSAPVTCYSLTALEAVFFSQLLGQTAARLSLACESDELRSLLHVWTWTSKAFKDGMVDSSWLSPNISRAMWHAATLEQAEEWQTALSEVRGVIDGNINPFAQPSSSLKDVSRASRKGLASLEAALRAVTYMIAQLDSEPQHSKKVELAMRAGLFAVVAFCQNWGGPEMVAVPGPLEHECLMACFVAPALMAHRVPQNG